MKTCRIWYGLFFMFVASLAVCADHLKTPKIDAEAKRAASHRRSRTMGAVTLPHLPQPSPARQQSENQRHFSFDQAHVAASALPPLVSPRATPCSRQSSPSRAQQNSDPFAQLVGTARDVQIIRGQQNIFAAQLMGLSNLQSDMLEVLGRIQKEQRRTSGRVSRLEALLFAIAQKLNVDVPQKEVDDHKSNKS